MCENWNNRHFHDCSPPVASPEIGVFRLLPLHSLSFQPFRKHCKLTIFNSFNFIAHEFPAGGNLLEIFRVFEGLAKDCISTSCKHIENRPEKDGVLTVGKRRFFSKKRRVSDAKTKSFESKDFVFFRKNAVFSSMAFFLLF